jgi:hypothetical protein
MMTKAEFDTRWREMFPEAQLTPHELRTTYPERWFRIHSLPEAKRYPEDEAEWESLLARQNETITEMIGHGEPFVLVAGDNYWEGLCDLHSTDSLDAYQPYAFTRLDPIELIRIDPSYYDPGDYYRPAFAEAVWIPRRHDLLLRELAMDEARAIFVSFGRNRIVAPYDGGLDLILPDTATRDAYRQRFREYLPPNPYGL